MRVIDDQSITRLAFVCGYSPTLCARVCACGRVCVCVNALTRSHTHLREGLWRFWARFGGKNRLTWVGFELLTCRMAAKGSNPYATGQLGRWLQVEPAHTLCAGGIPLLMPWEAQLWASIAKKRCEMGRRRCFHRLLRQKLCIGVSSDRKSISGTPKECFCITPGFKLATRRSRVRRPTLWTSLPLPERGFRPSPDTMSRAG